MIDNCYDVITWLQTLIEVQLIFLIAMIFVMGYVLREWRRLHLAYEPPFEADGTRQEPVRPMRERKRI